VRQLVPDQSEHDTRKHLGNRTAYRDFPFRCSPRAVSVMSDSNSVFVEHGQVRTGFAEANRIYYRLTKGWLCAILSPYAAGASVGVNHQGAGAKN
jgi:hypothetical protein